MCEVAFISKAVASLFCEGGGDAGEKNEQVTSGYTLENQVYLK